MIRSISTVAISSYRHLDCWFDSRSLLHVNLLDTILCYIVCQWPVAGWILFVFVSYHYCLAQKGQASVISPYWCVICSITSWNILPFVQHFCFSYFCVSYFAAVSINLVYGTRGTGGNSINLPQAPNNNDKRQIQTIFNLHKHIKHTMINTDPTQTRSELMSSRWICIDCSTCSTSRVIHRGSNRTPLTFQL
jgi:hypothetical protein